jgi:nickel-type superoxide dismutase maturation protease
VTGTTGGERPQPARRARLPARLVGRAGVSRFGGGFRVGLGLAALLLAARGPLARLRRSWGFRAAVSGWSMGPSLRPGDWLLVDPEGYRRRPARRGDLIVVPDPRVGQRLLVKRVAAVESDGSLVVVGDDEARSTDSRTFGAIDPLTVLGRPWIRYWPPGRFGRVG